MRMLMVGAGAVGGAFGARLAEAGHDIWFVARGPHAQALREHGLVLNTPQGRRSTSPLRVSTLEQAEGPFDLILISVKWAALEQVCEELPNLLAPHGVVVPMLNGLDSEDVVARYVGAQRTIACIAYVASALTSPGELSLLTQPRIGLAPYRPGQEAQIDAIAAACEKAQIAVRRAEDAGVLLWEKMVWNGPFNAICALTRRPAGWVADHMEKLLRDAMDEVISVARAEGVLLPPQVIELMFHTTRSDFPNTEPSMLQDVRAGRATEVDILQGAVVARAERAGIAVPVMQTLAALVRALPHSGS
jgi:2-dehydropantoate 2-reductase